MSTHRRLGFCAALALALGMSPALAEPPHYVSQRGDSAFLREGPSYQYKVLWVYRHRGYPFRVIASFDVWRRVQAPDGVVGWMNADMLTDQRTVLVTGKSRVSIHEAPAGGKLVGLADPGAVASLKGCDVQACHIHGQQIDGWIPRDRVWGVDQDEFPR
jgi:SH3-like domain-containing protein